MQQALIQFFAEYKAARSVLDRDQMQAAKEFDRIYHKADGVSETAQKWLFAREQEEVTGAIDHGDRAEMLTAGDMTGQKRYLLVRENERWLVQKVQIHCGICEGRGKRGVSDAPCEHCAGTGWIQWHH